jgi:hypothetical protein
LPHPGWQSGPAQGPFATPERALIPPAALQSRFERSATARRRLSPGAMPPPGWQSGVLLTSRSRTRACLDPARRASVAVRAIGDGAAKAEPRCDAAPGVAVGAWAWSLLVPEPGLVSPGSAINRRRVFARRRTIGGRWVIAAGRVWGTDAVGAQSRTLLHGRCTGMIGAVMVLSPPFPSHWSPSSGYGHAGRDRAARLPG